jgi:hypothetical protein
MFAYCGNNPVNMTDPTGELPTWIISGLIGAVTSVSCALISGERGEDLLVAAIAGFVGSLPFIGTVLAVISAVEAFVEYSDITDNVFVGFLAGAMSLGTSLFTGDNISKLPGVNQLDEAAELLFDAVIGYGANIFNTCAWDDISSYYDVPTESFEQNDLPGSFGQAYTSANRNRVPSRQIERISLC